MPRRLLAWQWWRRHPAEQRSRLILDLENRYVSAVDASGSAAVWVRHGRQQIEVKGSRDPSASCR
jgi:hypothetical protein